MVFRIQISVRTSVLSHELYVIEPRVAYFGEKTPESSDSNITQKTKWLLQKDVLVVLVETIPDTLSLGKEIRMVIQLSFSIFLAQLEKERSLHVIAVTRSFVRRIVTFAVYTLLVEVVQQKSILIQYRLLPVKER